MEKRYAVILAAGEGTRMKSNIPKILHPVLGMLDFIRVPSNIPKILHPVLGRSMVQHVIDQLQANHLTEMVAVVGHHANQVMEHIGEACKFVVQEQQLGTV